MKSLFLKGTGVGIVGGVVGVGITGGTSTTATLIRSTSECGIIALSLGAGWIRVIR